MRNKIREEIQNKINASSHLQKINLSNMKIVDTEIEDIMDTIRSRNPKISKFNLDNNQLNGEGAKILSECLKRFDKVEELSLQRNNIDKDGLLAILQLKNDFFSDLDLAFFGNQISDVAEMEEMVRSCRGTPR